MENLTICEKKSIRSIVNLEIKTTNNNSLLWEFKIVEDYLWGK